MAKLSKTDGTWTIGKFGSTRYASIKKGRISVDPDGQIDTSELLRAGFTLQHPPVQPDVHTAHVRTPDNARQPDVAVLVQLVQILQQELEAARQEKARLLDLLQEEQRHRWMLEAAIPDTVRASGPK